MLTAVKNNFRVFALSLKYSLMRELLNKVSFVMNVLFMVLNNASFIVLWVVLYSIKDNIGGSSLSDIFILWGLASGSYGISRLVFLNAFNLSDIINSGKLDTYLVQPKNVLINAIMNVSPSAFGDLLYAYILILIGGPSVGELLLYTLFLITGGIILTSISIIFNSLSFWFRKSDNVASQANSLMTQFATYPEGIFNKVIKILLYTVIPVGFANYLPLQIIRSFNLVDTVIVLGVTLLCIILAVSTFYLGLRKYSSTNLMNARV